MKTLRQRFFDEYMQRHPEVATSLGIEMGADWLRDHAPSALADEERWYGAVKKELDAVDRGALDLDDRLDHLCMQRLVDFHLHAHPWLYSTIDWSLYPYAMMEIQRLHAESDAEKQALHDRLQDLPRFLEQQEKCVDRAITNGLRMPDKTLRDFFVGTQLPLAIDTLRELGLVDAAAAYEKHRAWMAEIETADMRSIGEQELRFRLSTMLGIDEEPALLIARARDDLAEIQQSFIAKASELASGVTTLEAARELALEMQKQTVASSDVVAFYEDYVERAIRMVHEKSLLYIPDGYIMGVDILPPSMAAAVPAGNWPAPLLARNKLGHFLVGADAQMHLVAWAADCAVHEGLPGHHYQSFVWQRRFSEDPAPVRFLVVHDHVAIPRHYWGPMLNIEGWAVYAEELMRRAGFFTPEEELFVLLAHAVRAGRVVCDISLALGAMSQADVQRFLMDQVCFTEKTAWLEARRYAQTPIQASTYHLGRKAIEALAAEWDDLAAFHEHFLSFGPVDPRAVPRAKECPPASS